MRSDDLEGTVCPCGCGVMVLEVAEERDGKWYTVPIPEESYLRVHRFPQSLCVDHALQIH
jgi:hypothetical protein